MHADKYPDLESVKRHVSPDDFRIRLLDRGSWALVIAPHGGYIEPGTSAIARAIAGRSYSLFDFQGLREDIAPDMHVTATRFRDPGLSCLLGFADVAVSVHGMGTAGHTTIWLGGLNISLKQLVRFNLEKAGFVVNPDSPRYRGESRYNIVNMARCCGVQLEFSDELLNQAFRKHRFTPGGRCPAKTEVFDRLVAAVRQGLREYRLLARAMRVGVSDK
ncbi:MAG: poly-gamma-glutamate hydrolase family protein [Candidatus Melainabacteria bacterium]|nr:poly-gamma-glutamate hydrolase family protein [Candidatus Melainabacteria bacterium]